LPFHGFHWIVVIEEEMEALHKNKTWELVQYHFIRETVGGWVDRIAENP
jgi:hypothetical protein